MSKSIFRSPTASLIAFALCLLFPSTDTIQKYFGLKAVPAYLFIGFCLLLISSRLILPRFISIVTERQALFLALLTFLGLVLVFSILYPMAQAGIVGGGSDQDDALNIAATELIHGRYPYYPKTYLDNPIAPLPGAVILAVPFVLLGNSAYQNIFWLAVFFLAVKSYLNSSSSSLALLWTILIFSPSVLQNVVTGVDHPANTIYVLLFIWWMVLSISKSDLTIWKKLVPSALLGIGLSSRSNFILLLPLLFSTLVQTAGWKPAIKYIAVTGLVFGAITLPFWLYDPRGFVPLLVQSSKVARFQLILPFAGILIPSVAGAIAFALSFQRMGRDCVVLFRNCAIVEAFPILCVVVLYTIQTGSLNLVLAGYGLFFLFFGALALWSSLIEEAIPTDNASING
jgi:hypothetical protein